MIWGGEAKGKSYPQMSQMNADEDGVMPDGLRWVERRAWIPAFAGMTGLTASGG
jgi:hypothetical protein